MNFPFPIVLFFSLSLYSVVRVNKDINKSLGHIQNKCMHIFLPVQTLCRISAGSVSIWRDFSKQIIFNTLFMYLGYFTLYSGNVVLAA